VNKLEGNFAIAAAMLVDGSIIAPSTTASTYEAQLDEDLTVRIETQVVLGDGAGIELIHKDTNHRLHTFVSFASGNVWQHTFKAWELGYVGDWDIVYYGYKDNQTGDSKKDSRILKIKAASEPYTPILQYLMNKFQTNAFLSSIIKKFEYSRPMESYQTTVPTLTIFCVSATDEDIAIGDTRRLKNLEILVTFIDEAKRQKDYSRHYRVYNEIKEILRTDRKLGGTLNVRSAILESYAFPTAEEVSLWRSEFTIRVFVEAPKI